MCKTANFQRYGLVWGGRRSKRKGKEKTKGGEKRKGGQRWEETSNASTKQAYNYSDVCDNIDFMLKREAANTKYLGNILSKLEVS